MIRPTLINEVKANTSWNEQRVPPVGDSWKRSTYGFQFNQLFPGGGPYADSIPNVTVSGFASFNGAAQSLLSPTTDIALTDNISWIKGAHTLKSGLVLIRNRKDQNARSVYAGSVNYSSDAANPNRTFQAFGDALLGNFRTYTESALDAVGFFRFSQIEAFVSDGWRVNRKLSLEIGLRYQHGWPTWTQANNIANFNPALYDPRQAVTVITVSGAAVIDPTKGGNPFNGLVRAGAGVPQSELGRVPNGNDPTVLSVPTGAHRGIYDPQHLFGPRFSFAYAPFNDNKTAIRGGFGMFFDRPEGNLVYSATNLPPYAGSSQVENGNLANLASARAAAPTPFGNLIAIDPGLVTPRTMNFSLSIQRELPWGIFLETAYVGNLGRHLLRSPDINAVPFSLLVANAAKPSAQREANNAMRPYKGFSEISYRLSDSNSNYNSFQIYATKRKGDLSFQTSYTWSKALGDNGGGGGNFDDPEDPFNRSFNYGPLNYDRRHILAVTYTYRLPFFRKGDNLARNILGGWEASGLTRWQTGQYLNCNGNTSTGGRRADYIGGEINVRGADPIVQWFNKAAFDEAPNERRGTAGVGMIEGPGRYFWDISARKQFRVTERVRMQFQADFFNAFNQVLLNSPNTNVSSGDYGRINSGAPGRNIQIGLRLEF
ncbi:MAG TPA: carboxypeptidase regulatory-like domain-containing protein, partial [Blastocatellia bacterium]|nr:carboxypeptidase regulatory-like domain-containing protein [Blastocatellia bacterium]